MLINSVKHKNTVSIYSSLGQQFKLNHLEREDKSGHFHVSSHLSVAAHLLQGLTNSYLWIAA